MRGFLVQPPSVCTLITSLLSRVSASETWQRKYSEVLALNRYAYDLQVAVLSLPAARPRLQAMRWLLESLNSSACATDASVMNDSATVRPIFMTRCIRIIPMRFFAMERL